MEHEHDIVTGRGKRIYRSVAEKRRIVERTFQPGLSVPKVALAEGVNSHQVFDWRRAYLQGKLEPKEQKPVALLPVVLSTGDTGAITPNTAADGKAMVALATALPSSVIHIELTGRAKIRVEHGANPALLRAVLESLRP